MNAKEALSILIDATRGKTPAEAVKITARFVEYLKSKHRLALLPAIIRLAEKKQETEGTMPTLVLATEEEGSRMKEDIVNSLHQLGATEAPITSIDQSLVSGFVLASNGKRIDASGKRRLIELYSQLTA